ncbi:MAG: hypothetical protein Aurels2KO_40970 [Aureliella sp.]
MCSLQRVHLPKGLVIGLLASMIAVSPLESLRADPCGLVPPVSIARGVKSIVRTGLQKTYVFHHAGIETFIIHPGFHGNVKSFGMLVPFPSVPAIRKVPDDVFGQIERSIDPPEVILDLTPGGGIPNAGYGGYGGGGFGGGMAGGYGGPGMNIAKDETRVVREEAVGMYDVVVLQAGSSAALERWMDDNQYRFPTGMEDVCDDYIASGWCFVAVRARIGHKTLVDPAPGKTVVDAELQTGAHFDGHVQAMGFRFESKQLVVPMRLSTYNEGDLRNIVYVLTDHAVAINNVETDFVVRQISGGQLLRNLTGPLPLRLIGGTADDIAPVLRQVIAGQRNNPDLLNFARDLYTSDLSCARRGELSSERESLEKQLVNISERLGLRGSDVDRLHRAAAGDLHHDAGSQDDLAALKGMTLTVIDGDFPREILARENLTVRKFEMSSSKNTRSRYCVPVHGPIKQQAKGDLLLDALSWTPQPRDKQRAVAVLASFPVSKLGTSDGRPSVWAGLVLLVAAFVFIPSKRRWYRAIGCCVLLPALVCLAPSISAQQTPRNSVAARRQLLDELGNAEKASAASQQLAQLGDRACRDLAAAASSPDLARRGWAIATLAEVGTPRAVAMLEQLADHSVSDLNRLWLSAALLKTESDPNAVCALYLKQPSESLRSVATARLETLLGDNGSASTRTLISASITNARLKQLVDPMIVERGYDEIASVCYPSDSSAGNSGDTTNLRRVAAGYLAAMARSDPRGVTRAIAKALQFDPEAQAPPWGSGALFLPSMDWSSEDAALVYFELVRWWIGSDSEQNAVFRNNLRDLGRYIKSNSSPSSPVIAIGHVSHATNLAQVVSVAKQLGSDLSDHPAINKWLSSGKEPPRAYIKSASSGLVLGWVIDSGEQKSTVVFWGHRGIEVEDDDSRKVYALADSARQVELAGDDKTGQLLTTIIDPAAVRYYGLHQRYGTYPELAEFRSHQDIPAGYWVYLYPSWFVFEKP